MNVRAVISTRKGGVSLPPYSTLNLADHVGDDPRAVVQNRAFFKQSIQALGDGEPVIQWLKQVHGTKVLTLSQEAINKDIAIEADASYTAIPGLACTVLTADCLPLLFCNKEGSEVAAVHAGWRGLASGIVTQTVRQFKSPASELMCYLCPAISQAAFQVGGDVVLAFQKAANQRAYSDAVENAFKPDADSPGFYYADLYRLAKSELQALGLSEIYGGTECTHSQAQLYHSFRRDGASGRIASAIWIEASV